MIIDERPTLKKYKDTMVDCVRLYYGNMPVNDIQAAVDYSINKRLKDTDVYITNSYKRHRVMDENGRMQFQDAKQNTTLLKMADYIYSRQPIVTVFGTMFAHHGTVPNPLVDVVMNFLDLRSQHKKQMFEFPKGSEMFEKYNLLQSLDKIDANGVYGTLGMYTCLIYNSNVASSVTAQGRMAVSTMTLHFESMLANNVKFGSLDEVIEFINHVCSEARNRKFDDSVLLTHIPTREECFAKVILDTGYRWVPNDEELDIIWKIICNLSQEDITRIYYKNNLYEFVDNPEVFKIIEDLLTNLDEPFYTSAKVPDEDTRQRLKYFTSLIEEYVYYRYMYMDRIDRCENMIKSVTMVSDTDSTIVSVDAWYRFVANKVKGKSMKIYNPSPDPSMDEEGYKESESFTTEKVVKYDYNTDEEVEVERNSKPTELTSDDNLRYSIISILTYVLDYTVNDYMKKMCSNTNSVKEEFHPANECKIYAKNEFLFRRLMMTTVKKNYASLIEVQEGNIVPQDKQLDVKGIEILTKSGTAKSTRDNLKKILEEDILRAPVIDQIKFINDIVIFRKKIVDSIKSGSKEYYKPATVKSMSSYADPLRIQGIKASLAWNAIRPSELPYLNTNERNAIDIVKVNINSSTVEYIRDSFPDIYTNMVNALDDETFKTYSTDKKSGKKRLVSNAIENIALPLDVSIPEWLIPFIDYDTIIENNIASFPFESVGIMKMDKKKSEFTNIVQL